VSAFEFLTVSGDAVARSPMETHAQAAGARFEVRDGWNVAVAYEAERPGPVAWADVSHVRKLEVHGRHELAMGQASKANGGWWCPVTRDRALVVGGSDPSTGPGARDLSGLDSRGLTPVEVTSALAALVICGPQAREVFARFCALDLRPQSMPVGGFRPGSVARTPGYVLREDEDRFLMLFGWALGEYMWTVVADAARSLGGAPIGVDAPEREVARA
jgi:heterotetrameric sarcosine oxidase gamma subunit